MSSILSALSMGNNHARDVALATGLEIPEVSSFDLRLWPLRFYD